METVVARLQQCAGDGAELLPGLGSVPGLEAAMAEEVEAKAGAKAGAKDGAASEQLRREGNTLHQAGSYRAAAEKFSEAAMKERSLGMDFDSSYYLFCF